MELIDSVLLPSKEEVHYLVVDAREALDCLELHQRGLSGASARFDECLSAIANRLDRCGLLSHQTARGMLPDRQFYSLSALGLLISNWCVTNTRSQFAPLNELRSIDSATERNPGIFPIRIDEAVESRGLLREIVHQLEQLMKRIGGPPPSALIRELMPYVTTIEIGHDRLLDTLGRARSQSNKPVKSSNRRGGRYKDPQGTKRISEAWGAGRYKRYSDLARDLGIEASEVEKAVGRAYKQRKKREKAADRID